MPKIKLCLCLLILCALTACTAGGGYNTRGWDNRAPRIQAPAQNPPSTIGQNTSPGSTVNAQNANESFAPPPVNLPPVKVGILLPLSGQHKNLGQSMLNAAQIALFDVGHSNFELIPRDTKGTSDGARTAAQDAVNEGAQILLGPVFASSVRAAKPVATRARINMIGFSTDWSLAGDNIFIMGFLPFDQVERVTQFAAQKGISRVGVIAPQTDYGRIVQSTFSTVAPRHRITIAQNNSFSASSSNLAPDIRRFAQYDAREAANALTESPYDAILMPTGGQQARTIANLLTQNLLPPSQVRRIGTGLFDDDALATEVNLDGAWFAAPSPNARRAFESRYVRTYGTQPQRLSTLAYDATALTAILARTGLQTQNRPAFDKRSLMNPNGFAGIDGIFRFRPNGTAERGLAILEYRRGQIRILEDAPKTFVRPTPPNPAPSARTPQSRF